MSKTSTDVQQLGGALKVFELFIAKRLLHERGRHKSYGRENTTFLQGIFHLGPVGPIHLLGPVGAIHLLGPVGASHLLSPVGDIHWLGPVGPIHLLGPVGAIHLLGPVGPSRGFIWALLGPFICWALLGPFIC